MSRKTSSSRDEVSFKSSSGVNYNQISDRHIEDERFQRQRALREGTAAPTPVAVAPKSAQPSATMDAVMRMLTGKEERTIADRISDPNRPTWEQYKKENADKLDLNDKGEKEMREYRKKLDAAREKAFGKRRSSSKSKKKKRSKSDSSSGSDNDSDSDDSRSRKSRRKSKKSRKRRRSSSSSSESEDASSESDRDDRKRSRKHKKSKKKSKKHKKSSSRDAGDHSPSPVRLSSFFNGAGSDSD